MSLTNGTFFLNRRPTHNLLSALLGAIEPKELKPRTEFTGYA